MRALVGSVVRVSRSRVPHVGGAGWVGYYHGGVSSSSVGSVLPVGHYGRALSSISAAAPAEEPASASSGNTSLKSALKPKEVVEQLDKYIIGQPEAKKAVAIALRNRWRRHQLTNDLRNEVIPKNILMIGPTGCGKTEIARRIAKLSQAPFVKVEATKYTEVGFHGKDVDHIIRDLVDVSIAMTKKRIKEERQKDVAANVEDIILNALVGPHGEASERENFRNMLKDGLMEDRFIEIDVMSKPAAAQKGVALDMSGALADSAMVIGEIFKSGGGKKKSERKRIPISEARPILEEMESDKIFEDIDIVKTAIATAEESGIVFIDEIDKLVSSSEHRSADASSEGVQRDLLPLIEGSVVSTKHGNVNTEFILFIASGAFHSSKPSDLLAELQGRLPIRVTLKGLTENDFYRILTEPVNNLIRQQKEMLKTEDVQLTFTDAAIREIARITAETNKTVENIGARRLHTVIEKIVEEISFSAPEKSGETIEVDENYVKERLSDVLGKADLRKYIL